MSEVKNFVPLAQACYVDRELLDPDSELAKHLPYIGLEHVESGTGRIRRDAAVPKPEREVASATFRFGPQHVLYGKLRPYLNKVALPDFEGRCTTEIVPLRPSKNVLREYLALVLRSDVVVRAAERSSVGSRMPRADVSQLLSLEVEVPSLAVQRERADRVWARLDAASAALGAVHQQMADCGLLVAANLREQFDGRVPLSVGSSDRNAVGWQPTALASSARLESGHTPSRRHPEWWAGSVPWLALPDIRKLHGKHAYETTENVNDAGLANSSARLLPVGTVCLCRDASIGFVTILGRPMATSQHFANWICDPDRLDPEFLMYAFMASHDYLRELGSGSVLKTIYMPTIQSFHVCAPAIDEQRRIARTLRDRLIAAESLTASLAARHAEIERLPQRLLAAAFGDIA